MVPWSATMSSCPQRHGMAVKTSTSDYWVNHRGIKGRQGRGPGRTEGGLSGQLYRVDMSIVWLDVFVVLREWVERGSKGET